MCGSCMRLYCSGSEEKHRWCCLLYMFRMKLYGISSHNNVIYSTYGLLDVYTDIYEIPEVLLRLFSEHMFISFEISLRMGRVRALTLCHHQPHKSTMHDDGMDDFVVYRDKFGFIFHIPSQPCVSMHFQWTLNCCNIVSISIQTINVLLFFFWFLGCFCPEPRIDATHIAIT